MDLNEAKILIRSLLGRFGESAGQFQLPGGIISADEARALRTLCGLPDGERLVDGDTGPLAPTHPAGRATGAAPAVILINKASFTGAGPKEGDLRLCLDFGTAMSKAWATGSTLANTVPLILGRAAGIGDQMAVPSSIYISRSGRIYLGEKAERQHRQELQEGRQKFDNIKRILSDQEVGHELYDVEVDAVIDPTNSGITKGDLLELYLAWLTDLALRAVSASADTLSNLDPNSLRYVRRRFAIPCFADAVDEAIRGNARARWAESVMKNALLRAQVIADTLSDKWDEITVEGVLPILKQIRRLNVEDLSHLLTMTPSIREPVAAGASRFQDRLAENDVQTRSLMLVIDAGAGTTDFACFQVLDDPDNDLTRYALLANTVQMSRVAGNEIDAVLRPLLLKACGGMAGNGERRAEENRMMQVDLDSQIRILKAELFRAGVIEFSLMPNARGRIELARLTSDPEFLERGARLLEIRREVMRSVIDPERFSDFRIQGKPLPVFVLLTGGSASLPIVQALGMGSDAIEGVTVNYVAVDELPMWVESQPPEIAALLAQSYKQCAVAIGGAAPELPSEIDDFAGPILPPPRGSRTLEGYRVEGV